MSEFTKKMKWTTNRWGDLFAEGESTSYRIQTRPDGLREVTRFSKYIGIESLPTQRTIAAVKTLKRAKELAEIDRYHTNQEEAVQ